MARYEGISETNPEGKLEIFNRNSLDNFFKANPGKRFQFSFVEVKKSKTQEQLGYYWSVIVPRCKDKFIELGNQFTNQDTHEELKNHSPVMHEVKVIDEKEFHRSRSISDEDFTVTDMKYYIDDCIRFAAEELEIEIPDPIK